MATVAKAKLKNDPSEVAIENSLLSCLNLSVFIPWQSQKNIAGKSATLKKAPLHEGHLIFLSKIGLPLSQTKKCFFAENWQIWQLQQLVWRPYMGGAVRPWVGN